MKNNDVVPKINFKPQIIRRRGSKGLIKNE